jgi:hypothetical protein
MLSTERLNNLIDNSFYKYPLRTEKMQRINLIKPFYLVRLSKKNKYIVKFNEWVIFKDRWGKKKIQINKEMVQIIFI